MAVNQLFFTASYCSISQRPVAAPGAPTGRGAAVKSSNDLRSRSDKHVQLMLVHDFTKASTGVTSDMGIRFGHGILAGLDIDWAQYGLDDAGIDDLAEYMLRILQSFMIDPGRPERTGEVLRGYLRRWVAPVLTSEIASHRR